MNIPKGKKIRWVIAVSFLFLTGFSPVECLCATGYFNLIGTRGIPTLGNAESFPYTNPTAGDNWSGMYRYIIPTDTTTTEGKYLLRYPLNLPNGATITSASVFVVLGANGDPGANIKAFLRSKPWNASGNVTQHGSDDAGGVNGQHNLVITPGAGLL